MARKKKKVRRSQYDSRGFSRYARKREYLRKEHTPDWGFEVREPKPWKTTGRNT